MIFLEMRYHNYILLYYMEMIGMNETEDFYNPYEDIEFLRKLRKEETGKN